MKNIPFSLKVILGPMLLLSLVIIVSLFGFRVAFTQIGELRAKLKEAYSPLVAFCILIFTLIATPCVATIVITKKESGALKWALLQFFGLTLMAYIVTTIIYQVGRFFV